MRSATEREIAPSIRCAHDICDSPATLRSKLTTGWANVCRHHYEFHHQRQAQAFCKAQGIETVSQKHAWIKDRLGDIAAKITRQDRTPGEDDE